MRSLAALSLVLALGAMQLAPAATASARPLEQAAADLMSRMSPEERIGQLVLVTLRGSTLGAANLSAEAPPGSQREARPTVGLFVDTAGTDVYDVPGSLVSRGDGVTWSNPTRTPPIATERSMGKDL